ncbi:hypothetical protein HanRHA438_Chr06g0264251 [Helianthus annuus]|nr:hypothetical protein HanRHA438_Chr06g0264251 [Helianthus annuus]
MFKNQEPPLKPVLEFAKTHGQVNESTREVNQSFATSRNTIFFSLSSHTHNLINF